jgi:hypothetical protein
LWIWFQALTLITHSLIMESLIWGAMALAQLLVPALGYRPRREHLPYQASGSLLEPLGPSCWSGGLDLTTWPVVKVIKHFLIHWGCGKIASGLYYENIMIINDASRVVSEWHHCMEHHLQSSITIIDASVMLLESSIMLLENIYKIGVTYDNCHMTIVIAVFIVQDTSLFADSVKTYVPIWVSSLKMAINSNYR